MGQKDTLALLREVGGFTTAKELSELARLYYEDEIMARDVGSNLYSLKKWESVEFDDQTKIWSVKE